MLTKKQEQFFYCKWCEGDRTIVYESQTCYSCLVKYNVVKVRYDLLSPQSPHKFVETTLDKQIGE